MQEKHAHHILDSRAGLAFLSSGNWWMDGFIDEWTNGWMDGRRRRGKKIMWPMTKRECTGTKYKRDLVKPKRVHFNDIAALKSLKRQQDQTFPDSLDKAEEWVFPLREIKVSRCFKSSGRKTGHKRGSRSQKSFAGSRSAAHCSSVNHLKVSGATRSKTET